MIATLELALFAVFVPLVVMGLEAAVRGALYHPDSSLVTLPLTTGPTLVHVDPNVTEGAEFPFGFSLSFAAVAIDFAVLSKLRDLPIAKAKGFDRWETILTWGPLAVGLGLVAFQMFLAASYLTTQRQQRAILLYADNRLSLSAPSKGTGPKHGLVIVAGAGIAIIALALPIGLLFVSASTPIYGLGNGL